MIDVYDRLSENKEKVKMDSACTGGQVAQEILTGPVRFGDVIVNDFCLSVWLVDMRSAVPQLTLVWSAISI